MLVEQGIPAHLPGFAGLGHGGVYQFAPFVVERGTDSGVFDERYAVAGFYVGAYAEARLLLLFYAYGDGHGLLAVLEEPVGHGIAHLRVFPPGLGPEVGAIAGKAGTQDVPYFNVRVVGVVHNAGIEYGHERDSSGVVDGRNAVFDEAEFGTSHVGDVLHMDAELVPLWGGDLHVAIGNALLHVEAAGEAVYIPYGCVQLFVDEAQVDAAPVGSFGNAGVVVGESVLPPFHASFV